MNSLTLIVIAAVAIWWIKPLRTFLVERTNRTVKVLLVVFPLLFVARVGYQVYNGQQDDFLSATLMVAALLGLWLGLVWLGNAIEKRRPTKAKAPDLAALSRLPGMPRIPTALANPEVQRAAQTILSSPEVQRAGSAVVREATRAAAQVDTKDVAGSIGRIGGRWAARMRKSMASDGSSR